MASRVASCSLLAIAGWSRSVLGFQATPKGLLQEERELLAVEETQQSQQVQAWRMCHWGPEQFYKGLSGRAQAVWTLALEESGLDAYKVSEYACNVPKMPWSWVEEVRAMDHTKVHDYNFQGSYMFAHMHQALGDKNVQYSARNWLIDFAKENFTEADLLKISDISDGYKPMGPYDKSVVGGYDSHHPDRKDAHYFEKFDKSYFEEMAASNFTLCPGGDRPWSMRLYEAIAAGSIPVINSVEFDTGATDMWALWAIPYKYYLLGSGEPLVYRQDWVDHNLELFIKYQTFHEGDNTLPNPFEGSVPAGMAK